MKQLLEQCLPRGYVAAYRWLGHREESRDACQEAAANALAARDRYDASRPFYPWFYRILKNQCFDRLRSRRRDPMLPAEGVEARPADQATPEGRMIQGERSPDQNGDGTLIRSSAGAVTGFKHDLLISTTGQVAGRRICKVLGLVRGNSVRARHVGRDIMAVLRNIVGGEIREYTKLLAESREQALDRMAEQARAMGANAVVEVRFTTSVVMGGAAELLAYGTGVVLAQGGGGGCSRYRARSEG